MGIAIVFRGQDIDRHCSRLLKRGGEEEDKENLLSLVHWNGDHEDRSLSLMARLFLSRGGRTGGTIISLWTKEIETRVKSFCGLNVTGMRLLAFLFFFVSPSSRSICYAPYFFFFSITVTRRDVSHVTQSNRHSEGQMTLDSKRETSKEFGNTKACHEILWLHFEGHPI